MKTVSNTSPLIAFAKLDRFDLLCTLVGIILVPETVYRECLDNCTFPERLRFEYAHDHYFTLVNVKQTDAQFSRKLGKGEQEALTLAIQEHADLLLMDDRKGYNEAQERGLTVASTRAILKIAEERQCIPSYDTVEQELRKRSFFVSRY